MRQRSFAQDERLKAGVPADGTRQRRIQVHERGRSVALFAQQFRPVVADRTIVGRDLPRPLKHQCGLLQALGIQEQSPLLERSLHVSR